MTDILQDLSEKALIQAIEANLPGYLYALLGSPALDDEVAFHDEPDLLWSLTDEPYPIFNEIMRARLAADDADAKIKMLMDRGAAKGVPLLWWTGPATEPADLAMRLMTRGFRREGHHPGMAVDLRTLREDRPTPATFTIERVRDETALRQALTILRESFGFAPGAIDAWRRFLVKADFANDPAQRHYLGWLDGEPVATSAVIFEAGVAGIYNVTTLPGARRQGIGAAMTVKPLLEARDAGYRVGVLHSTKMGLSLYQVLGFVEYCKIDLYMWWGGPPTRSTHFS